MPIQTLRCPVHGDSDVLVKMDRSDCPATCPKIVADKIRIEDGRCGEFLERVIAAPGAFPKADSWRK